jgi:hypothetical protein
VSSVVNLNRFRKAKARADKQQRAAENRAAFGRSNVEKRQADAERRRGNRELDNKRLE